jgi:hypothetical protein
MEFTASDWRLDHVIGGVETTSIFVVPTATRWNLKQILLDIKIEQAG